MSDLISRQAAIEALKKISFLHWFECGEYLSEDTREIKIINSNKALEAIEALPTAQPDIIRCKDCKFWTNIKRTNRYWCKTDDGLYDLNPSPNDFCSRAERRTDERTD